MYLIVENSISVNVVNLPNVTVRGPKSRIELIEALEHMLSYRKIKDKETLNRVVSHQT